MTVSSTYCPNCQYRLGVSENLKTVACPNCYREFNIDLADNYYNLIPFTATVQDQTLSKIKAIESLKDVLEKTKESDAEYLKRLNSSEEFFKEIDNRDFDFKEEKSEKSILKKERRTNFKKRQKPPVDKNGGGNFFKIFFLTFVAGFYLFFFFMNFQKKNKYSNPNEILYGTKIVLKTTNIEKNKELNLSELEDNLKRKLKIILRAQGYKSESKIIFKINYLDNFPDIINILIQNIYLSPTEMQNTKDKLLKKTEIFFLDENHNKFINSDDMKYAALEHSNTEAVLLLVLNNIGKEKLAKFTQVNVNKKMFIYLGDKLLIKPRITEPISGGRIWITNNYTDEQVNKMADRINLSLNPFNLKLLEIKLVSPKNIQ